MPPLLEKRHSRQSPQTKSLLYVVDYQWTGILGLTLHARFLLVFTPVHCSWTDQVEPWFSLLQRKRLHIADFADKAHLADQLEAFVAPWNARAHPFRWSGKSAARVMAKCQPPPVANQLQAA